MVAIMCGHCYRPATVVVYVKRRFGRRPARREVCAECLARFYGRKRRHAYGR